MENLDNQNSFTASMIWIIGSPLIFALGVAGNLLTIIVLARPTFKKTSTSVFLIFLALADLFVIVILLPRSWINYVFGFDIRHTYNAICKLHWFSTFFGGSISSGFLVLLTIERILCIRMPHKVKMWFTVRSAIKMSVVITCIFMAVSGCTLYGMGLYMKPYDMVKPDNLNSTEACVLSNKHVNSNDETNGNFTAVKFLNSTRAPALTNLSICNGHESINCLDTLNNETVPGNEVDVKQNDTCGPTIQEIHTKYVCLFVNEAYEKFSKRIFQPIVIMYNFGVEGCLIVGVFTILRHLSASQNLRKGGLRNATVNGSTPAKESKNKSPPIAKSLVLVCIVFVVCKFPVQMFLIVQSAWVEDEASLSEMHEVIWACCNMLFYLNHAVNFLLYFLSGPRFREQVKEMLGCQRSVNRVSKGTTISKVLSAGTTNSTVIPEAKY